MAAFGLLARLDSTLFSISKQRNECESPHHMADCRFQSSIFYFSLHCSAVKKSEEEILCVKNLIIELKLVCQQIFLATKKKSIHRLTLLHFASSFNILFLCDVCWQRDLMVFFLLSAFWHKKAMFTHSTPPLILLEFFATPLPLLRLSHNIA